MPIRIALVIGMLLVPDGLRANDSYQAPGLVVMDIQAVKGVPRSAADVLVDMLVIELRKTHAFGQFNSTKDLTELVALEQAKAATAVRRNVIVNNQVNARIRHEEE